MSFAILNLVSNIFMSGFAFIGIGTTINKLGKFCKVVNENKKDGFKSGFDVIMLDSVEEMNRCVESLSTITKNSKKIFFIIYDLLLGNKIIKKDKDGKIMICNKLKIYSGYKHKIEELSTKVKKYQEELFKIKKKKENQEEIVDNLSIESTDINDEKISDASSDISSDISSDGSTGMINEDEFYLDE
jgi:hypothetical protein